jgi:hypothetical protein
MVVRPWWRTPTRWHARPRTGPVLQMYEADDPVTPFMKNPQHSLKFHDEDYISRAGLSSLLKVFLPSHKRFYLVVVEVHCDLPGFPTASRNDICEQGLVIRRRRQIVPPEHLAAVQEQLDNIAALSAQLGKLEGRTKRRQKSDPLITSGTDLLEQKFEGKQAERQTEIARELVNARQHLADDARTFGVRTVVEGWFPSKKLEHIGAWQEVPSETPAVTNDEDVIAMTPLIPAPDDTKNAAAKRNVYFAILPVVSSDIDKHGAPHFDEVSTYEVRCYVRRHKPECPLKDEKPDCHGALFWSEPSEPFRIASPHDLDGTSHKPINMTTPDLDALKAALTKPGAPKVHAARIKQPQSINVSPPGPGAVKPSGNLGGPAVCSFAIPLFFMVAYFIFQIFLPIFMLIFQLWWMLALNFCTIPPISFDLAIDLPEIPPDLNIDASLSITDARNAVGVSAAALTFMLAVEGRVNAQYSSAAAQKLLYGDAGSSDPPIPAVLPESFGTIFNMVADPNKESDEMQAAYARSGDLSAPPDTSPIDSGTSLVDALEYYADVEPA